jgi:hypothetical protein
MLSYPRAQYEHHDSSDSSDRDGNKAGTQVPSAQISSFFTGTWPWLPATESVPVPDCGYQSPLVGNEKMGNNSKLLPKTNAHDRCVQILNQNHAEVRKCLSRKSRSVPGLKYPGNFTKFHFQISPAFDAWPCPWFSCHPCHPRMHRGCTRVSAHS